MSTATPVGSNRRLSTRGSISGVFDPLNTNSRRNSNAPNAGRRSSAVNQILGRPAPSRRASKRSVRGSFDDIEEGGKRHEKVRFV